MSKTPDQIADDARAAIEARAASGAIGTTSTSIDGTAVAFDDEKALDVLDRLERRAARATGNRRVAAPLDLRNAW